MKKKDWMIVGSVLLIAIIWLVFRMLFPGTSNGTVTVTIDGKVYGTYSLEEDQTIRIQDTNVLEIRNGAADMTEADCPDQICVHQHEISKAGESIICLPNKVVVTVDSGEEAQLDAVTN